MVVAAGSGSRLGGENKVWRLLSDRPLWWWAASRLSHHAAHLVLVVGGDRVDEARTWADRLQVPAVVRAGGRERWESSAVGIREAATPFVAVHDAARPLVPGDVVDRVYRAARDVGAAVPAVPAADTVKLVHGGRVARTLPRSAIALVQTPQIFRVDWIRPVLEAEAGAVTDDVSWLEQAGRPVAVVAGDPLNRKITTAEDWDWLLQHWRDEA